MAFNWEQLYGANPTTIFEASDILCLARSPYAPGDNYGFLYSSLIPLTTAGDLFAWDSTFNATRLPVGDTGTFLTADSSETIGLSYTTDLFWNKTLSYLGVGTTSPEAPIHILGNVDDIQLLASDTDTGNKAFRIASLHYDNPELPFVWGFASCLSGSNTLNLGGGTGYGNAATAVDVWCAGNSTTPTGTQIATFTINGMNILNGGLAVGYSSAPIAGIIGVGDENFHLDFDGGVEPGLTFDADTYISYNRSNTLYTFRIDGDNYILIDPTDGAVFGIQGVQIGAPLGGNKGVGTLNVQNGIYQDDVPVLLESDLVPFTPTMSDNSGNNFTLSAAEGYLSTTNGVSTVWMDIVWSSKGSAVAGDPVLIHLTGLTTASSPSRQPLNFGYVTGVTGVNIGISVGGGSTAGVLVQCAAGVGANLTVADLSNSGEIQISGPLVLA